tara:strand:+ start:408 stop:671 length:264 start_codon:yes stop_codon:yes gene_type:complete
VKVDNTAEISDQLNTMWKMMETIDCDDPEVQRLKDRVIDAALQMVQIGMNMRLLDMVGESHLSEDEEEIIDEFTHWAADITAALESD